MDTIKFLLKPHVKTIVKAADENAALVYTMYGIIKEFVEEVIDLEWQNTKIIELAIIGGIMINTEGNKTDVFYL
jgi:hypothetical protein